MRGGSTENEEEEDQFDNDVQTKSDEDSLNFQINDISSVLCLYLINKCLIFLILCIYILMLYCNSLYL